MAQQNNLQEEKNGVTLTQKVETGTSYVGGTMNVSNGTVTITVPSGLRNGDWKMVHCYDPDANASKVKKAKLDQLITWITVTFNYGQPLQGTDMINKAFSLFNSGVKDDMIALLTWLNDPKDN